MYSQVPDSTNDFRYFCIEDTWYLQQYKSPVDGWMLVDTFFSEKDARDKIKSIKAYIDPKNVTYVRYNEVIE